MATFITSDEIALARYDFGGEGSAEDGAVLLAHAAGLCATVLGPLAQELATGFHCHGYDARGHGHSDRGPVASPTWSRFGDDATELAARLTEEDVPLIGFGHSLGATALLLAEQARPGTFARLYLYEPIVRLRGGSHPDSERLAVATARRRDRFELRDEAYARFSARPPFNAVAAASLQAYVDDGLSDDGASALHLSCRPEDEAAIYRLGPLLVDETLVTAVTCPVHVGLGGASHDPNRDASVLLAEQLAHGTSKEFPDRTHFGPLEDPSTVASWIIHQY